MTPPTLLEQLAAIAHDTSLDRAPPSVVRQAVLTIADTVACMAAGSRSPDAMKVIRAELARSGPGSTTVLGTGIRLSMEGAARANAYMGDIHELNDLTCGHAGIGNVAAVLAMGEAVGGNGSRLLDAICTGIEVTSRIYSAFYPTMKPYTEVGMVSVGPAGSAGSAAACAKLLGLDEHGLLHAMAVALAQAGWCPAEVIFGDGGTAKPLMFGSMPAAAGIAGALQAQQGLTGPTRILEGPMGYLRTVSRTYDPAAITRRDCWYLDGARRKLHACCGYIHSAMDSLIAIRHAGLAAGRVQKVRVSLPAYIVPAVSKQGPPMTAHEARFHLQYLLALALTSENVILPLHSDEFERFAEQREVRRLMQGIEVVSDPEFTHYHASRVELFDSKGELLVTRENRAPKGSAQNPLTEAEIWDKLRVHASKLLPGADLERYIRRLDQLAEESAPASWILRDLNATNAAAA